MALDARGGLTSTHVCLVASGLGVSVRTVRRWVEAAPRESRTGPLPRPHFTVTSRVRGLLAVWGGDVAAVHRELVSESRAAGDWEPVPSLATLQRVVARDLSKGERAGLRGG